MPFEITQSHIPGVLFLEPRIMVDDRGFFCEIFKMTDLQSQRVHKPFVQANLSKSWKNVLRGLHYQNPPKPQAKLVGCVEGEVYDVAVDIRKGSPTYGRWVGVNLSAERHNMIYVPEGFAHGFCVISPMAQVMYLCNQEYSQVHESLILWNDPALAITWPVEEPVLSAKDSKAPLLENAENNFEYDPK